MALQAGGALLADEEHTLGVRIHRRRSVFRVAVKLRLPSKGGGSALLKDDFFKSRRIHVNGGGSHRLRSGIRCEGFVKLTGERRGF